MDDKELREFLKSEYFQLQSVIEGFDKKALTVKAWSVTFSMAAVGSAFAVDSAAILIVASGSAIIFWFLEGQWKSFQYAYYKRSRKIEDFFALKIKTLTPLQIGKSWYDHWREGGLSRLYRIMCWPHVALPHVVVLFVGLVLYLCVHYGLIDI